MRCHYCEYNYIEKLLHKCIERAGNNEDGLKLFNQECIDHHDPRNLVTILGHMYSHDCSICNKYRNLYSDVQKQ